MHGVGAIRWKVHYFVGTQACVYSDMELGPPCTCYESVNIFSV